MMAAPISFGKRKKRSHDLAYFIILLTILFGTFIFVSVYVNYLLRGIPIPH
jgi:hypothetical protein